jgi:hypothetical protein
MDEIKKVHSEIEKENEDFVKNNANSTIGNFLLKNHEEIFNNMDLYIENMASNSIKRFMMLNGESDGIDLILKIALSSSNMNGLYSDVDFKTFIIKMNEYFKKIQENASYEKNEQFEMLEKLIYDKFRLLEEKLI